MKNILILIVSITSLISCSSGDDSNASGLNIRLSNVSDYDFENIVVNTSSGDTTFENLSSHEMTSYKSFKTAYRYAFVKLEINGETYTLQPIDYVGETTLEDGNYTYKIDANDSLEKYGKLTLTLIEE